MVRDLTGVSPQIAWDPTESTSKAQQQEGQPDKSDKKRIKVLWFEEVLFALAPPRLEETPQRVNGHRGKSLAPQLTIQRAKPRSRNDEVRSSE